MKKFFFAALTFVLGMMTAVFTACSDNEASVSEPEPEPKVDYTIIYYGCGGGSLDSSMVHNMQKALECKPASGRTPRR